MFHEHGFWGIYREGGSIEMGGVDFVTSGPVPWGTASPAGISAR